MSRIQAIVLASSLTRPGHGSSGKEGQKGSSHAGVSGSVLPHPGGPAKGWWTGKRESGIARQRKVSARDVYRRAKLSDKGGDNNSSCMRANWAE